MIQKQYFGTLKDSGEVFSYLLRNQNGMTVRILNLGGAIMELKIPDKSGRMTDVVSGYDSLRDYMLDTTYFGALIGRVANRIANGRYTVDGKEYSAFVNNGPCSLHGGKVGFSHRIWSVKPIDGEEPQLVLTLHSPDGEEGYPGNLDVTVTYTLLSSNALSIHYEAKTDRSTPINLTNHAYFNLGGYAAGKIFDHVLRIDADRYIPTDADLVPTGEIRSVEGTPFDFREPKTIGRDFYTDCEDLRLAGGYDHCLCFSGGETREPVLRIEAYEPNSGRLMQVYTNQPCVQLYSGNFLNNAEHPQKGGYPQITQTAFCLETQKMPDAINRENFNDVILSPNDEYHYTTIYKFSVR